ncbi:PLP-dependent cysteine synthase family protein [Sphaerisporangium fuscum]|uniref:PLP-dependent cysteine synthase family protein n=1 Tax=Sphaerisporangium fuscum TaxID=2835868 RepID=UPI001BDCBF10|nr:pyridoxal-phosphate dependent enzyme [Sphaerisporangium fuscum]
MTSPGAYDRWAAESIKRLEDEAAEVGPTPLRVLPLPAGSGAALYLKDESAHPTGSLKHRLARALFAEAMARGRIREGTTVVGATGGPMAVAEAYFARLLGLPYIAVMPGEPSPERAVPVERLGGECRFVSPPLAIYDAARELAAETSGHFMDHFSSAAAVADRRAGDLAAELFGQLPGYGMDVPRWVVAGAGTGATSGAVGRHVREHGLPTRLAVADPENSAYFPGWASGAGDYATGMPSRIEGVGRPRMEPAFVPALIDMVVPVPDAASVAAARHVRAVTGLPVGGSTGTTLWASLELIARMRRDGIEGAVVTLIADAGPRHLRTYHDDTWAEKKGLDPAPYTATLERFLSGDPWEPPPR